MPLCLSAGQAIHQLLEPGIAAELLFKDRVHGDKRIFGCASLAIALASRSKRTLYLVILSPSSAGVTITKHSLLAPLTSWEQ